MRLLRLSLLPSIFECSSASLVSHVAPQPVSLLQIKRLEEPSQPCPLPEGGTWAEVRLTGLPPFMMAVRTENDWLSETLRENQGYWEIEDLSVWGPPGEALDIGGNIGYYSFALANAGWTVNTFEPLERNTKFIEATLCQNPHLASRIKLHKYGLGNWNSRCAMVVMKENVGNGVMRCSGDVNTAACPACPDQSKYVIAGSEFEIHRLADVLKAYKMNNVDFVKLDIEGYECEALKGADDFLTRYHPRLVKNEVWQSMERCKSSEYFQMYESAGYRFGKDDDPACKKNEVTENDKANGGNFYMCKD